MSDTNYAVAPGEYLGEWMDENGVGVDEAAGLLRSDPDYVRAFLAGRVPVTDDMAVRLADVTGIVPRGWRGYEKQYRADLARLSGQEASS